MQTGQTAEALPLVDEVLAVQPENSWDESRTKLIISKARALQALGRQEDALQTLMKALLELRQFAHRSAVGDHEEETQPSILPQQNCKARRGAAFPQKSQEQAAVSCSFGVLHEWHCGLLVNIKRRPEAVLGVGEAIRDCPSHAWPALRRVTDDLLTAGEWETATGLLSELIEAHDLAEARLGRASAWIGLGRMPEAQTDCEMAFQQLDQRENERDACSQSAGSLRSHAHFLLASCLFSQGEIPRLREALHLLDGIRHTHPAVIPRKEVLFLRGRIFLALGDATLAMPDLLRCSLEEWDSEKEALLQQCLQAATDLLNQSQLE